MPGKSDLVSTCDKGRFDKAFKNGGFWGGYTP